MTEDDIAKRLNEKQTLGIKLREMNLRQHYLQDTIQCMDTKVGAYKTLFTDKPAASLKKGSRKTTKENSPDRGRTTRDSSQG